MLNETFEMLTASLRTRRGHVLKFIGDAMLATISFEEAEVLIPGEAAHQNEMMSPAVTE